MNNVSKKYISTVKTLFPVVGKNEREYIKTLSANIEDYCCEHNVESVQELYENYASPADVVRDYYAVADMEDTIRNIRLSKIIKTSLITICVVLCITLGILLHEHVTFSNENAVISESSVDVIYEDVAAE